MVGFAGPGVRDKPAGMIWGSEHMVMRVVLLAGLVSGAACLAAHGASPQDILDKDFERMMAWLPGRYDNQEQVYFQKEAKLPAERRRPRLHYVFYPAQLSAFTGRSFYVQRHRGEGAKIDGQWLFVFSPDRERGAIRLHVHGFKNPQNLRDAHLNPRKLRLLTTAQTTAHKECVFYWRRSAGQFVGNAGKGCAEVLGGSQRERQGPYRLDKNTFWIGAGTRSPIRNRKARPFRCWIAVKRPGEGGWYIRRGMKLHDQGGRLWLKSDDLSVRDIGLKMRNVVWPYGPNRPSLVLYVHEKKTDRAVSYAWSEPTAGRVGVNLRWMQASCTADRGAWYYRP